jgi:phosphoribosyl-AMP cyclohydrolase
MGLSSISMVFALAVLGTPDRPSWPTRVSELRLLLQQGRFDGVEKAIVESQQGFEGSRTGEDEPWAMMQAFPENDRPTERALSEWVVHAPSSYAALAARGLYYEGTGWSVRGTKWTRDTTSGQMRSMNSMHASAEADCEKALTIKATLVACHVALINIAKSNGEADKLSRRYDAARRAVPGSVLVATARLESLTPRWGGSYEKMQAFLQALAKDALGRTAGGRALLGYIKADQAWIAAINGDYPRAIELYTEAIAQGGGASAYYAGRGTNAQRLGRNADALRAFDRAIEMSPHGWPYSEAKLPLVLAMRAGIRYSNGQRGDAEADIRDSLVLDPSDAFALEWARTILPKRRGK